MHDSCLTPAVGAGVWYGRDLSLDTSWEYVLDERERCELEDALKHVNRLGHSLPAITARDFALPRLSRKLKQIANDLRLGRGFAILRNFPLDGHALSDLEKMYWGLCSHLGVGVTQNSESGFIHYVTDGKLRPQQGRRGVGLPGETPLHVDLSDVASLLCLRQAPDAPQSRFASSLTVYNEILRQKPELMQRLLAGYEWDRMDEHGSDETPTSGYRVPVFSQAEGAISCQYNRNWMANAATRNGQPLSPDDIAAFDFFDAVARAVCFEFSFQRGDVQFCNNYSILHGRAAHAAVTDEAYKRVLLRIWLDIADFRPFADEAIVRKGTGCHGRLGWSAPQVLAGEDAGPRLRRTDGALALP